MNKNSNNMSFIKAINSVLNYTKEYKRWYIISLILIVLFILSEIITNTAFSYSLSNVIEKNNNKKILTYKYKEYNNNNDIIKQGKIE